MWFARRWEQVAENDGASRCSDRPIADSFVGVFRIATGEG
jgi:hypothetical protein